MSAARRIAWLAISIIACSGSGGPGATPDAGGGVPDGGAQCPAGDGRPRPSAEMAGAVDRTRNRIVFFGGDVGEAVQCNPAPEPFGELWYYDVGCSVFVNKTPASGGPGKRTRTAFVHDTVGDRLVVFGGRTRDASSGPYTLFDDTWALKLGDLTWEPLTTTGTRPSARNSATAVFNPSTRKMIVYGGNTSTNGAIFTPQGDVHELNLQTLVWQRLIPQGGGTPPAARLFHAAAIDPTTGKMYVYGGGDANAFFGPFFKDLWVFDLGTNTWERLHDGSGSDVGTAPLGRIQSTLTFDASNNRLILFAGHDDQQVGNNNDTWAFNLNTRAWTNLVPAEVVNNPSTGFCSFPADFTVPTLSAPDRRSSHLAALDAVGGEWTIVGGRTDCGIIDDIWNFSLSTSAWKVVVKASKGEACLRHSPNCATLCQ